MTIISVDNDKKLLTANGSLDKSTVAIQSEENLLLKDGVVYRFDLSALENFDSAGLAFLLNLVSTQRLTGGDIALVNCPDQVTQLIALSELEDVLETQSE